MVTAESRPDDALDAQVRAAPFIFTGRIVKPQGSTVGMLEGQPRVGVVKVETVLRGPLVVGPLEGRTLTLKFADGKPTKLGTRAMFYAASWLYAEGIAVVELARAALPKNMDLTRARIVAAGLRVHDEPLVERLRQAELVVTGRVERTAPPSGDERPANSEHDPLWRPAVIAIEHTEKGHLREHSLIAYFPASLDEYWLEVAKLEPGIQGTFILHREAQGKRARFPAPGPALMHALDFQPAAQTERVRLLLKLAAERE